MKKVVYIAILSICVMGFLSKIFGDRTVEAQSQNSPSTTSVAEHKDWAVYLTKINGTGVGSVIVDLELRKRAPIKDRPIRLEIDIKFQNATKDGFYSPNEGETISEIDDLLQNTLTEEMGSIYAGHLIHDGHLYLFHYIRKGDNPTRFIDAAMSRFPLYIASIKTESDPSWKTYLELLYPEPIQMQGIQNGRLVDALRSRGDHLETPRKVDHWIYFSLEADRERFLKKIEGKGFRVESKSTIRDKDGRPFQVHLSRIDKITLEAVDGYVFDLWQIADDCNGQYDGWETFIVKE